MDAAKVNVLPKVEEPSVSKKEVEYATFTTPATSIPAGTIGAYTGKETQPGFIPGYVRLGYGNYGNLDVLANYLSLGQGQTERELQNGRNGRYARYALR